MDLKKYIIDKSKELSIDIIGFTESTSFSEIRDFLENRRIKGYETEFEEKNIELRYNPKKLMEESKTIIVIGASYNIEHNFNDSLTLKGRLSKSSWGIDYHKVLKSKMENLINEIKKIKNFKYVMYVDTGPLVERELAKRAGIGWYGKNCSIINEKYGSFIFLGYIITDLDIEIDKASEEQCGECTLCINACPTKAIVNEYFINPKKCVSYLTQTKERIPYDLREKMGIKIYGCDTCQLVCPLNKEAIKVNSTEFVPNKTGEYINLEDLITISNKQFKEKYGHMAGSWRGRNILRRNAIIALGNIGDKRALSILMNSLKDPSPMIREYSAWALLKIDKEQGMKLVNDQIKIEKDEETKKELERLIEYFKGDNNENWNN